MEAHPKGMPAWKPVTLTRQLVFEGGYQREAFRLDTKDIATDNGVEVFVKLTKNSEWLIKAAAGKGARPGALQRSKVFDDMKAKLVAAVAGPDSQDVAAVAAPDVDPVAADDPMAALAELAPPPPVRAKRMKYSSIRGKDNITTITMPALDPSAHPGDDRQREVQLLASSTTTMWLAARDVDWLTRYVADEYSTGGVALDDSAVADDSDSAVAVAGNCRAPGVRIEWDFDGGWEATVLHGDNKGTTVTSKVHKLNLAKWTVVDAVHHYDTVFESASEDQLKTATFDVLEQHMQKVVA